MPIYEYACTACHHRFEILQRLGENGEGLECPKCGHQRVAKQFSTFAGVAGDKAASADPGCGQASCCRTAGSFG